jgi:hypothetical protein
MTDGSVYGTGLNGYGELGTGNTTTYNRLTPMLNGTNIGAIPNMMYYISPPPPTSNICFLAETPVKTDQGYIHIDKINPYIHTIDNKPIVAITKTVSEDKYLICFEKNALGRNIPSENTKMTREHRVYFQGKAMKAQEFLGKGYKVYKVKYSGEILYNVLMENHDKMSINNLVCETLHPENLIAKIYMALPVIDKKYTEKIIENANKYHNYIEHKQFECRMSNALSHRR